MIDFIVRRSLRNSGRVADLLCVVWVGGVSAFVGLSVIYIWGWLPLMVVLLYSYWSELQCHHAIISC